MARPRPRLWLAARQGLATAAALSDLSSRARYVGLRLRRGRPGTLVPLNVSALAGHPLWVRPHTSDVYVVTEDFVYGHADPPPELRGRRLDRIVELGSNIGVGLCLLAQRHPGAQLLGVEAHPANAAVAERNVRPWADRVQVLQSAVWSSAGEVVLEHGSGLESGFVVRDPDAGSQPGLKVDARTVEGILDGFATREPIDYLYMDLEGTHQSLLRGDAPWLDRVRAIKVAGHASTPYSEEECARDLERHGFVARVQPFEVDGWAVGVRP